ncbi:hypothetical protein ABPG72_013194 [Tetrahymena utriculariae]
MQYKTLSFQQILALFSCIYSISIILLSTLPIVQLYQSLNQISQIQDSFQKYPLVDLKILNADGQQTCEHFNMQKLFNFSFPSISEGCVCKNGEIKMSLCNQTFKGSKPCSPQGDGENVYKQEGFQVENWGLRINTNQTQSNNYTSQGDNEQNSRLLSFQICGLYNTQYNYLNSFDVQLEENSNIPEQEMIYNNNSCQYVNKEYDLFNLSSFNNLTYQNCPITSIKIIDTRSQQYLTNQHTYYLDIPSSDYMKFQVKRDPNTYPLSQIQVQWGSGICLNNNWPFPINSKYAYTLYNIQVSDCQIDSNFYPIFNSQLGQKDLITSNHQESYIQKLPNLINDNINQFSIFARLFPKMSWQCRTQRVKYLLLNEININNLWYYEIIICILALCYIILIELYKNSDQRIKAIIVYKFILSVVNIGIQIGVIYYINDNMINIIDSLCDQRCVDESTYDLLKSIKEQIQQIQFYVLLPLFIYACLLTIELIYLFIVCIQKKIVTKKQLEAKSVFINNQINNIENAQLDRDIAHVLQQTALNHAPRNEHARISSLLAINQNVINPNSIFQIRMDEDQDISEKNNTTKDTHSIKRNIDFY